jgi:hypothetical protein
MRIGKPLAILLGLFTIWPIVWFCAFFVFVLVTALTFVPAVPEHPQPNVALYHQPHGVPLMVYLFIPHILTLLLMFALMAFYIVHVFKNAALQDDRRVLWAVVLFMGLPFSAPIYWWLFIRRPARGNESV